MNSRQNEQQQSQLQNSRHINYAPPISEAPNVIQNSQLPAQRSSQQQSISRHVAMQSSNRQPQPDLAVSQYYQSPMINPPAGPIFLEPSGDIQGLYLGRQIHQNEGILRQASVGAPVRRGGGVDKMNRLSGVFIKQKVEMLEAASGCETENIYHVFALDDDMRKKGPLLFRCKERSTTCSRFCLPGECRPFQMAVSSASLGNEDSDSEPFLSLERPCKWSCLCCNRPEVKVTLVETGQSEYLGKIFDHWNLCDKVFDIHDRENSKKYVIAGGCCQVGFWCRCVCDPCQKIDFSVKAPSGETISRVQKRSPGVVQAYLVDADFFAVEFPKNSTATDKALLMSAVLFMDYRLFEGKPQTSKRR